MESSVCWDEISSRLKKLFVSPIRDLILNQDSYGQLFFLLGSQQFFPAIPCLTFYAGTLMFVWRNHNMFEISSLAPSVNTKYFIPGQAVLMWTFINILLTFWLFFQKVLYCFVWYFFTQNTKPWQNIPSERWWFSGETEQLESTLSLGVYLCQPEYVSWVFAEITAVTIFYAMNMSSFKTQYKFEVQKMYSDSHVLKMKLNLEHLNPGLFPTGDYKKDGLNLFGKFIRTKNIEGMQGESHTTTTRPASKDGKLKLKKCLTTLDLTSLGVGSCVGTGMYLVSGMVARNVAGPGVIVSFIIAAIASIFSGACYAEFGVRVPHTTGSAYMYSYVTVGELIAFVIGWNMILEYLIGTSACACALSACFDALANGQISSIVSDKVGTLFGRPPDFLAFVITLLMMLLMAAGVKKSLVFNNILNAVNLSAWVFLMAAGLFYIDTDNWAQHKGFLPYGWSGVFTGAATCFYAFIGFDIIATTGEEANNPKKSIPLAIVTSLAIILIAYVTSSMMLTLIVPYESVDPDAALVEMFGQVNAPKCKYIIAVGALAGLTVSMFGSMFPMPRIVYAMAQDGLIFRTLSQVWPSTGTPLIATFSSGLFAALAALVIKLEVLVEMMSIGTLLAYTLVSTCVLILRYQPHSTNLMELLPESLRTPMKGSPTKDTITNGQVTYGNQLVPEVLRSALGNVPQQAPIPPVLGPPHQQQRIMVRRVTRSSPDSDDTFPGEESEEVSMRDDQFLVADRTENKFYGTVRGGGTGASTGVAGPSLGYISRRLQAATYLCPAIFPWVDSGPATEDSGMFVMKMVGILYILIIIFDLIIVLGMGSDSGFVTFFFFLFLAAIIAVLLVISRKPQNRKTLLFMTPGLPFVPAIAVMVNIYLIFKLSILTLVRFTVWMIIGFGVYFYYGIKHSSLEEEASQNIELSVTTDVTIQAPVEPNIQPQSPSYSVSQSSIDPFPTKWDDDFSNSQTKPLKKPTDFKQQLGVDPPTKPLFVSPSQFPSWDD